MRLRYKTWENAEDRIYDSTGGNAWYRGKQLVCNQMKGGVEEYDVVRLVGVQGEED